MKLTTEQLDIINSTGNIKINAVAGSGKTTTIIEYARARPRSARILYIAFNKSVKLEAKRRFRELGLHNVTVETAHSLAFKNIVPKYNFSLKHQGYKISEIVELLGLQGNGERYGEYIIANHINKFISYFCNSDKQRVQYLNYLDIVTDPKARTFVSNFYKYIEKKTRILLAKMDRGKIHITHDFYLKKFQLSHPKFNYDYILFDEGQDASSVMLDIFLRQDATKVIVGDTHQQIYGWRYAVNSLEKTDFTSFNLTKSFRFNQAVADLAIKILEWKNYLPGTQRECLEITGLGRSDLNKSKAILARTNLGLLLKAIEYVTENNGIKDIYFEGNIFSYTYADDGTSLYDVLNLYNDKRHLIRDKLIKQMRIMRDLEDYVEKTEDVQLGMMIEIVKEYGNSIPGILENIKARHIDNEDKEKAGMIFSTVHRSKGMEYDSVQIVSDFINETKLKKIEENPDNVHNINGINEEINLLYVAVTRSKNHIYIPETILPEDFNEDSESNVHVLKVKQEEGEEAERYEKTNGIKQEEESSDKAYSQKEIRKKHKAAYMPWTQALDDELTRMFCENVSVKVMASNFGRTKGAIYSRIKKLELREMYN